MLNGEVILEGNLSLVLELLKGEKNRYRSQEELRGSFSLMKGLKGGGVEVGNLQPE